MTAYSERMTYVCVVTGLNLPNLEACLAHRPSNVLLLVSRGLHIPEAGRRLKRQIEGLLPDAHITVLGDSEDHVLRGDGVIETQQWAIDVLLVHLRDTELAPRPHSLNMSGGTKAMTAVLVGVHDWNEIDYKAQDKDTLEVCALVTSGDTPHARFIASDNLALPDVSAIVVAQLYADHAAETSSRFSGLENDVGAALSEAIWQAQEDNDPALETLFQSLENIWSHGRNQDKWNQNEIAVPWSDFLADGTSLPGDAIHDWLSQINRLAPDVVTWDDHGVRLPGNKPRKSGKELYHWLNGGWLELLAYRWLRGAKLPEEAVARNVVGGSDPRQSSTQREADLLIHYQKKTRLIEIKAGLPPNHKASDLENQISSLVDRFGRTDKALLIGPQLRYRLEHEDRLVDFKQRCRASQVKVITCKQELIDFCRN